MAAGLTVSAAFAGDMLDEARNIIADAARAGVHLRLVGGLAVLAASRDRVFATRPIRDIDLIGLRRQSRQIVKAVTSMGFEENRHVRFATAGQTVQFYRECRHLDDAGRRAHDDDRIDVYLDAFRLDHEIALKHRLGRTGDMVSVADVLLVKLQRTRPAPDDLHDAVAILKDLELATDETPETIDVGYLAALCARDWPLYHDVTANLARCRDSLPAMGLSGADLATTALAIDALLTAIARRRKSLRWRLRALVGERLPWSDMVDEGDAKRIGVREGIW